VFRARLRLHLFPQGGRRIQDGLIARRDSQDGTLWIYLHFENADSLLGYLTKNAPKEQERVLRFIASQKGNDRENR